VQANITLLFNILSYFSNRASGGAFAVASASEPRCRVSVERHLTPDIVD
jgi:hypothetical protein